MARIYVLGSIIPVPGLKRENDIILRTYHEIRKRKNITYRFAKSINYTNRVLKFFHPKFNVFHRLNNLVNYKEPAFNTDVMFYRWFSFKNSVRLKSLLAPLNFWLFGGKVLKDVISFSPDLIHANNMFSDGYMAYRIKKQLNIPYILTLRCDPKYDLMKDITCFNILNNASVIICHNFELFERYRKFFPIHRLPHGIDQKIFKKRILPYTKNDTFRILTVSRLLDWKNIDLLINSITSLCYQGFDIQYTIIGEGPEGDKLNSMIAELDMDKRIRIKPWVNQSELFNEFEKHHLLALVSYPETLGRVYFEAIACSLPILCAKNSGSYGLISDVHGGQYSELDKEMVSEKVIDIMNDYYRIAENAQNGSDYLKQFDWNNVSDFYFSTIMNLKNRSTH